MNGVELHNPVHGPAGRFASPLPSLAVDADMAARCERGASRLSPSSDRATRADDGPS